MRKSKEEKVIAHATKVISELESLYKDGLGLTEYNKLLNEYKKLNRRHEKTIKLSDNMGKGIIKENTTLSDNLEYTVKTARSKILENISEHRKTKEKTSIYKEQIKEHENDLNLLISKNNELEKKIKYYEKEYGTVKKAFYNSPEVLDNASSSEFKSLMSEKDLNEIISKELSKEEVFYLSKIAFKNFQNMIRDIEKVTSTKRFITTILKFIKSNFSKGDIVIHYCMEVFYIIVKKDDEEKVINYISNLNKKRDVLKLPFEFTIGFTKCNDSDNIEPLEDILLRVDEAFKSSLETNKIVLK